MTQTCQPVHGAVAQLVEHWKYYFFGCAFEYIKQTLKMEKVKCPYCGKEYSKKGIGTHIWRVHGKGKEHNPNKGFENGTRVTWNKGLTKETDDRVKSYGETIRKTIETNGNSFEGKHHTKETRNIISKKLSKNNKGGRCKWFKVEKPTGEIVKVQGTWEQRFAKILNIIDKHWIKPSLYHKVHSFNWVDDNGEKHTYTPDFYSPKLNKYFEVKGYWWGDDKKKMEKVLEQNNINIEIIQKKELEIYEKLGR